MLTPDDIVLKYVKEHSPKRYAEKIEKRCQITLDKIRELQEMHPVMNPVIIPPRISIKEGCPHCKKSCAKCLWTEAVVETNFLGDNTKKSEVREACTLINFNGHNWGEVTSFVVLLPSQVVIYPWRYIRKEIKDNLIYKKTVQFLQGHINWAKEEGWGKYCK